jgi:hypothetical protein
MSKAQKCFRGKSFRFNPNKFRLAWEPVPIAQLTLWRRQSLIVIKLNQGVMRG